MNDFATQILNVDQLLMRALREDITSEDITTNAIIREEKLGQVQLICKEDGVLAGLDIYKRVFELIDDEAVLETSFKDGDEVHNGDLIAVLKADVRAILSGERVALNYLQRMSGVATHTRKIVKLLEGSNITLLDTRKTTPNNRIFEKYAVKVGGGSNHRYNLSDGILIKDNHIDAAGGIKNAVTLAKKNASFTTKVEVETESKQDVLDALDAKADIIMLDNMTPDMVADMVKLINGRAIVETSGNITIDNIYDYAQTGVDIISVGALTHSFKVLDISLKNLTLI